MGNSSYGASSAYGLFNRWNRVGIMERAIYQQPPCGSRMRFVITEAEIPIVLEGSRPAFQRRLFAGIIRKSSRCGCAGASRSVLQETEELFPALMHGELDWRRRLLQPFVFTKTGAFAMLPPELE